jgi:hypothetical protein
LVFTNGVDLDVSIMLVLTLEIVKLTAKDVAKEKLGLK